MKIFTSKSSSLIVTIQKNTAKTCGAIRPLIRWNQKYNEHHEYSIPECSKKWYHLMPYYGYDGCKSFLHWQDAVEITLIFYLFKKKLFGWKIGKLTKDKCNDTKLLFPQVMYCWKLTFLHLKGQCKILGCTCIPEVKHNLYLCLTQN